jgi:hypothetical protein
MSSLQLRVIALVMVIPPKPPGSRQLISPDAVVLGNRLGKGLARNGAAARIDIVADAGELGVGRNRRQ